MSRHEGDTALLTDLYQLTMAQGYVEQGKADTEACFHMFFRENPFGGGFTVAAGLAQAVGLMREFGFSDDDLAYLRSLTTASGGRMFTDAFLAYLRDLEFTCDVDAVAEGTVCFPREPLIRVTGPIVCCQLLETALLNCINFQSLVATKAARVCIAAEGDPVAEFGLRRAQGPDGGVSASRAAYIGGCASTSNTLAGKRFGIPVSGTHAHSWVMAFDSELEAFRAYARSMPDNCTLLVDTYDAMRGVRNAIVVGAEMRARGERLTAIRLDSGDLAWLSRRAREMLDEAGFPDVRIVASNDLDEHTIASLKDQGAAVDAWGVGTRLATAYDQPALGGVYKLSAIRRADGAWVPRVKLSEQVSKMTVPGVLDVRRYRHADGSLAGDMVFDVEHPPADDEVIVDPADSTRRKVLTGLSYDPLLAPVMRAGRMVADIPDARAARERCASSLGELDPSVVRFLNPHEYPVGLERGLHDLQMALVLAWKGIDPAEAAPQPEILDEVRSFIQGEGGLR